MIKFTSRHIIFTCIFIVVCAAFVAAQEETQPNLETILKNADEKNTKLSGRIQKPFGD